MNTDVTIYFEVEDAGIDGYGNKCPAGRKIILHLTGCATESEAAIRESEFKAVFTPKAISAFTNIPEERITLLTADEYLKRHVLSNYQMLQENNKH